MSSADSEDTGIATSDVCAPTPCCHTSTDGDVSPKGIDFARASRVRPLSAVIVSMRPRHLVSKNVNHDGAPHERVDEFGFCGESEQVSDGEDESSTAKPFVEDEKNRFRWIAYLEFSHAAASAPLSWQHLPAHLPRDQRLSAMLRDGIPHTLRPHIWTRISGALLKRQQADMSYSQMVCQSSTQCSLLCQQQIDKDILRILPTNVCFCSESAPGTPRLRRILLTIAWIYPDIGYCQGLGHVVAVLLLFLDEENAFWLMATLIEDLLPPSYYSHSMLGIRADQMVLYTLVQRYVPELHALLCRHDTDLALVTASWLLTLFASTLHVRHVLRVWDVVLYDGETAVFRLALAMLAANADRICQLDNSADIFSAISAIPANVQDIDLLIHRAFSDEFQLTSEDIAQLRREHTTSLSVGSDSIADYDSLLTHSRPNRRHLRRSKSMVSIVLFGDAADIDDLKTKNIRQTELIVKLCAAIRRLGQHFADSDSRLAASVDLRADYSRQSHVYDQQRYHGNVATGGAVSRPHTQLQRAKALIDFERRVDDELGFRRNDVITVVNMADDHCWVGQLNGLSGWFPAKFVQLLDERSKQYSRAGDDSVNETVTHLVRGPLCTALKNILEHGMKRSSILGGGCHPWLFIEEVARREVAHDYDSVYSRLVLCKTFRLDRDGKVLSPEELLYRCVEAVNASHDVALAQMDVKLRSLVCVGLNEQVLHLWLQTLCSSRHCVDKWYDRGSIINSPGWIQVKCELRVLAQFSFELNVNWELKPQQSVPKQLREGVQDMLIKHHLFSWDL